MGEFVAYRADSGERLWSAATQAGVLAAPISYAVDGEQYVAIEVGWGGAFGLAAGELARDSHIASNQPRVLVYKLGGTAVLPNWPRSRPPFSIRRPMLRPAATVTAGKALYHWVLLDLPWRQRHGIRRVAGSAVFGPYQGSYGV
jgi:quinohemoprotein ethanol dehydrogenase